MWWISPAGSASATGCALGVDAIDYQGGEDVQARLAETCPNGVNVFFDNVGGEILDAGLASLVPHARIVICGIMSATNDFARRPGIRNHIFLLRQRASMRGFLVFDYLDQASEAIAALAAWASEGKIKTQVDVVDGLENAPDALRPLHW